MARGNWLRLGLLVAALVAAVAWPLLTYALSLAAFGLAHVLSELRYLKLRFGERTGARLCQALVLACAAIALERSARQLGWLGATDAVVLELALGLAMCLMALPELARTEPRRIAPAIAVALALAFGIALSPIHALLALAVLHNLTPLPLLADATPAHQRRQRDPLREGRTGRAHGRQSGGVASSTRWPDVDGA